MDPGRSGRLVVSALRDAGVRLLGRALLAPWRASEARAQAWRDARAAAGGSAVDGRAAVVLCFASLMVLLQYYYGDRPTFVQLWGERWGQERWFGLAAFGWWSGAKVLGFVLLPMGCARLLGLRLGQTGLALDGAWRHLGLYAALFGLLLPLLVLASGTESFAATYPLYRQAARSWGEFIAWELIYGASFLGIEYFFRGFLLFSLERSIGALSIFVSTVPYCMVHFGKPAAESAGAIVAGVILGTLALHTRSIWAGLCLHLSVALTMDLLVLFRVYGWPGSGRFVG
jgi:hypothetical protein